MWPRPAGEACRTPSPRRGRGRRRDGRSSRRPSRSRPQSVCSRCCPSLEHHCWSQSRYPMPAPTLRRSLRRAEPCPYHRSTRVSRPGGNTPGPLLAGVGVDSLRSTEYTQTQQRGPQRINAVAPGDLYVISARDLRDRIHTRDQQVPRAQSQCRMA